MSRIRGKHLFIYETSYKETNEERNTKLAIIDRIVELCQKWDDMEMAKKLGIDVPEARKIRIGATNLFSIKYLQLALRIAERNAV